MTKSPQVDGPTSGQRDILGVLGVTPPKTKREASILLTQLLAQPGHELRWRCERARRYVAKCCDSPRRAADDPQDSHAVVFGVASVLVQGFGLTTDEAWPIFSEYLQRSDAPWADSEIRHKLSGAAALGGFQTRTGLLPRGCLIGNDQKFTPNRDERKALGQVTQTEVKKVVTFDPEKLAAAAMPWNGKTKDGGKHQSADLLWLANRSSVDPAVTGPVEFFKAMYPKGEKILCFTSPFSQGEALWPAEPPPTTGPEGVWFLPQPVTGEVLPNPEGKKRADGKAPVSRRTWRSVADFRYIVLESDKAEMRDWLGFMVQVPLRIEALYTSGGRSIHALVRVDCRTAEEWLAEKMGLMPFLMGLYMVGGDKGTLSNVRLSRLPGCWREGKYDDDDRYEKFQRPKLQKLLYLRPGADGRPICELPPLRDVEAAWCGRADQVLEGREDASDELRHGLGYYANVSPSCATALKEIFG